MLSYRKIYSAVMGRFIWMPLSQGNPKEFVIKSYTDKQLSPATLHREFYPTTEEELMEYVDKTMNDPSVQSWEIINRNELTPA